MLGLGQAPFLAAFAQYGFQALAETLLVTLQLCHQAAAVFQLAGCRQAGQLRADLLLTLLQGLGALVQRLDVLALVEFAALQLTHLPDTPATYRHPGRAQQQGQRCQATAGALGRWVVTGSAGACADG